MCSNNCATSKRMQASGFLVTAGRFCHFYDFYTSIFQNDRFRSRKPFPETLLIWYSFPYIGAHPAMLYKTTAQRPPVIMKRHLRLQSHKVLSLLTLSNNHQVELRNRFLQRLPLLQHHPSLGISLLEFSTCTCLPNNYHLLRLPPIPILPNFCPPSPASLFQHVKQPPFLP